MRRCVFAAVMAAVMVLGGSAAWQATSATSVGAAAGAVLSGQVSPIQPTACGRTGEHCPPGYHWWCGPAGHCRCIPC